MAKKRVLIVDDHEGIRWALATVLRERDFVEVVEARNGVEALDRLRELPVIDVVITELELPALNGDELIRIVRQEYDLATSFVMYSGSIFPIEAPFGVPLFYKPDGAADMLEHVRKLLRRAA